MRTRTALAAGLLALAAFTAACGKSDEEIATDCQKALAATKTATLDDRPGACKDLSEDDYSALLFSQGLRDSGVIDDNGNVDAEELLSDD
ncbi:hypothetical protein KVH22_29965 [Streptomyces olivaceus]|uniref:hypothetical protein n=1 Tax=Streptomyces olivaceus TaxID=47716 RepID=UPI001CCF071A|nr:hypothetical protein [Streptomyces olivaceus]MBZ6175582.1 hypothetical protein [Streptomyces olivaceus]MBZ6181876.1 hypothetical protein [Streptomyces olivaceus]MBZ6259746.1 hypothetical protein [Streptomyces olivaceus]